MIPERMKAVLLTGFGGPEKLEYRTDVPVPRPGPGEVLIKVGAAGVNNTDIWTREGAYGRADDPGAVSGWRQEPMEFPRIQGADICGTVAAAGSGANESLVGRRVLVDFVLYAGPGEGLLQAGIIGSERDGGFAEYVAVPAENTHPIQSGLTDAELASFPVAYVTAERMLNRAGLEKGETILITGATGGVGSALVQLAGRRGARVIALAGAGKEEPLRDLGATVVTRQGEGLAARIREAAGGRPIDLAADVVGGKFFMTLLDLVKPGGRLVTAGAIAGPVVELDLRRVYLNHLTIIGSTMGAAKEFRVILSCIQVGKIKPLLARTYPLSKIREAQEDFKKKGFFGKLVLVPD